MKIQKKLALGIDILPYYFNKEWEFENDGILHLRSILNRTEKLKYGMDSDGLNRKKFSENLMLSMRRYTLNNNDESLPKARQIMTG